MTELKTRTESEPTAAAHAAEHEAIQRQKLVRSRIRSVLKHAALIAVGLIMIYPLLWLVVSSFRPTEVIFRTPGLWLNELVLENYTQGWFALNYPFTQYIINSTIVVVGAVAGNLFACSLAAYAFARLKFRLKTLWFAIMLMTIMLPVYVIVVPQYIVFNALGWVNTFVPLILPKFLATDAFFVFLMVQFIRGIPRELDEAARIDGCGHWRIFSRVMLPLMGPAIATTRDLHLHLDLERLLHPVDLPDRSDHLHRAGGAALLPGLQRGQQLGRHVRHVGRHVDPAVPGLPLRPALPRPRHRHDRRQVGRSSCPEPVEGSFDRPGHTSQRKGCSSVSSRRRYLVVGLGNRVRMYLDAMTGDHRDDAELVGLIEPNAGRLDVYLGWLAEAGLDVRQVKTGGPDDLERLIDETGADAVIVTSPDFTHADLTVRALNAGTDVVVEKPLTIDPESTRRIAEAAEASGRKVVVTHNYRYSPRNSALKDVIKSGAIGTPLSVTFEWVLDTAHGADYFRRWHRDKTNSGGLLVHKAAHHFDLINWLLADAPVQVFARGRGAVLRIGECRRPRPPGPPRAGNPRR